VFGKNEDFEFHIFGLRLLIEIWRFFLMRCDNPWLARVLKNSTFIEVGEK